jgi:putative tryptophan/tyrosine transport system substrate-binding protein
MMRRRDLITLLGGAAAWPLVARAQQPAKIPRIGYLSPAFANTHVTRVEAFRGGLSDLGYLEGRNIVIEYRWAEGRYDWLPELAAELVHLKVDVIVTFGTPGILAAKGATTTIPIVMASSGDAEATGLVAGISRPGGNVTGLTFFNPELAAKRLEMLKEAVPHLVDVAILTNPDNPVNAAIAPVMKLVARSLGLELHQFEARGPGEFGIAISAVTARRMGGLIVIDDTMLIVNAKAIADLTVQQRLPSIGFIEFALAGGLMAYGVKISDMHRRAAAFVDRILKGAKPGDLPVERSTKFEVVVNLKTAKALGVTLPVSILLRADEVIE